MTNPFASRVSRQASEPQSLSELDQFVGRLRNLGATDEEIETVRVTWDHLDDTWTANDRTSLTLLGDDDLRAELAATRDEYRHDTTTEPEQEATDAASHLARTRAAAAEVVAKPIAAVLAWVGDDAIRAIAVLELELGDQGAKRKGIDRPLRVLVAGDDPGGIPVRFVGETAVGLDTAGAVAG